MARYKSSSVSSFDQWQPEPQAAGSLNKWGGGFLKKLSGNMSAARYERRTLASFDSIDMGLDERQPETALAITVVESPEINHHSLEQLVSRMRGASSAPRNVDDAYRIFEAIAEQCVALCAALVRHELERQRGGGDMTAATTTTTTTSHRNSDASMDSVSSFGPLVGRPTLIKRRVSDGRDLTPKAPKEISWLSGVRNWKQCLEDLLEAFKISLAETYRSCDEGATPDLVERLFTNKKFRSFAIQNLRESSSTRDILAKPEFFPRFETRFTKYDRVEQELRVITHLLQSTESGISADRKVEEYDISTRGDAVLEFANMTPDRKPSTNEPVLRFRVSSHMLAETSPIFARMFSGHHDESDPHASDDMADQLPALPPASYVCKDGSEARLYRMPQKEFNREGALEILLHAAHLHNDRIPREVEFEQFVAIAEACLRYMCTLPLELFVEHLWLPQWMHMGAEAMPDGLLLISYVFGSRSLFTRMTKSAVLNIRDERELQMKPWPQKIKDKVWAVRCAKMAQLHTCCMSTVQEYIRAPTRAIDDEEPVVDLPKRASIFEIDSPSPSPGHTPSPAPAELSAPPPPNLFPSSTPRCPKGSHECDANNLGFLLLVLSELQLLPIIMKPGILAHMSDAHQTPKRSLAQLVKVLRSMPSPPNSIHRGGVCDPAPAFRTAISDIYNSVAGLTLFDVTGIHGYALSRNYVSLPQARLQGGLRRIAATDGGIVSRKLPPRVMLTIMKAAASLDDLHALATVNRAFYEMYKRNELVLMKVVVKAERRKTLLRLVGVRSPLKADHALMCSEGEKVLKVEGDVIKEEGPNYLSLLKRLNSNDKEQPRQARMKTTEESTDGNVEESEEGDGGDEEVEPGNGQARVDGVREKSQLPKSVEGVSGSILHSATRARPASPLSVVLTHDEANKILWPNVESKKSQGPPPVEGLKEKFRAGDPAFTEGKTLSVIENKQLRDEQDRTIRETVVVVVSVV